ncbi:MAG: serine/threonine-protein kinase, partial [Planctomycetota bacterium]
MNEPADDTTQRDPLDLLSEQFLLRRRRGEDLGVEAFASAHPEHADGLRGLLPTLLALEDVKRERASSGSGSRRASVPKLERLGDFRIVRELGRGGMGVVFEAVQESLGRKVALKVLPQSALLTGNQLERFRREAQIAAQLHHSNIVPVFGSGESDGYHWYAMQFIAGVSLEAWRDQQREAPPVGSGAWKSRARFVARLGVQAAQALHCAHELGTLHRDIKPGNLLLEQNDHLWVTDFGLAKALEAEGLTNSGDLLGTLQYMAPEQFAGHYDARSEVYALGVTLYELLALRPAFGGGSRTELMERIRTERPEALRRRCPDAPGDLLVVVDKAMAREPADRYRDAAEFAADLQAFLDDRPIAARRLSTTGVVWRWCRRNRGMAALAASTLLAVVGAGVTGWIAYGITDDALGKAEKSAGEASAQAAVAAQQSQRAETNLATALDAFGDVFDALVGPDPALALEEDEETGEQTLVVRSMVQPRDVALLQKMLEFYGRFATENAGNQALQLETARANRRVGAIHVRLGRPEDLEAAAKAYTQAAERFAEVTDRDVRREIAGLWMDRGQLEQRRWRLSDASRCFEKALALLAALPNAASKAIRFEQAAAHFALALNLTPG